MEFATICRRQSPFAIVLEIYELKALKLKIFSSYGVTFFFFLHVVNDRYWIMRVMRFSGFPIRLIATAYSLEMLLYT